MRGSRELGAAYQEATNSLVSTAEVANRLKKMAGEESVLEPGAAYHERAALTSGSCGADVTSLSALGPVDQRGKAYLGDTALEQTMPAAMGLGSGVRLADFEVGERRAFPPVLLITVFIVCSETPVTYFL